ncbi:sodium ion-translocating decarboxylase subunit beta [Salmonella enterica subsp. enterica]|nr:sodium ion-translocating decarboxylase subunit beta [Salmonella enterica subsp. enterica]
MREAELRAGRARVKGRSAGAAVGTEPDGERRWTWATRGVLALFYKVAIGSGVAPLVIFMGVGAMTDSARCWRIAHPAARRGGAVRYLRHRAGALTLNYFGLISFTLPQAAAIGIIGGADGPTAIYLSGKLARGCWGHRGGGVCSYMALVPLKSSRRGADHGGRAENPHGAAATAARRRFCSRRCCCCWWRCCCRTPPRCWDVLLRQPGCARACVRHTVQKRCPINIVTIFLAVGGREAGGDKFLQPQTLGISGAA